MAVVVMREPRRLLEMRRRKRHCRLGAKAQIAPCRRAHQRLLEPAADGFARAISCSAEPVIAKIRSGTGVPQPLEFRRQLSTVKVARDRRRAGLLSGSPDRGASTSKAGTRPPWASRSQPSSPQTHFWDPGLAAERRAAGSRQRPASTDGYDRTAPSGVSTIWPWPVRCNGASSASFGRHQEGVGMQLIGAGQIARARHRHRMVVAGAAFGHGEIVPAVAPEQMCALDQPVAAALKDVLRLAGISLPAAGSYCCNRMPAKAGDAWGCRRSSRCDGSRPC